MRGCHTDNNDSGTIWCCATTNTSNKWHVAIYTPITKCVI